MGDGEERVDTPQIGPGAEGLDDLLLHFCHRLRHRRSSLTGTILEEEAQAGRGEHRGADVAVAVGRLILKAVGRCPGGEVSRPVGERGARLRKEEMRLEIGHRGDRLVEKLPLLRRRKRRPGEKIKGRAGRGGIVAAVVNGMACGSEVAAEEGAGEGLGAGGDLGIVDGAGNIGAGGDGARGNVGAGRGGVGRIGRGRLLEPGKGQADRRLEGLPHLVGEDVESVEVGVGVGEEIRGGYGRVGGRTIPGEHHHVDRGGDEAAELASPRAEVGIPRIGPARPPRRGHRRILPRRHPHPTIALDRWQEVDLARVAEGIDVGLLGGTGPPPEP